MFSLRIWVTKLRDCKIHICRNEAVAWASPDSDSISDGINQKACTKSGEIVPDRKIVKAYSFHIVAVSWYHLLIFKDRTDKNGAVLWGVSYHIAENS